MSKSTKQIKSKTNRVFEIDFVRGILILCASNILLITFIDMYTWGFGIIIMVILFIKK